MCWGGRARLGDDVRYGLDVLSAQPSPAHRSPTRRARRWGVGPGSAGGGGAGGRTARRWPPGVHCTHCTHCTHCSDNCSVFTVHLWWRHRPRDERPHRCCTTLPPSEKKTQKMIIWHHRHDYRRRSAQGKRGNLDIVLYTHTIKRVSASMSHRIQWITIEIRNKMSREIIPSITSSSRHCHSSGYPHSVTPI